MADTKMMERKMIGHLEDSKRWSIEFMHSIVFFKLSSPFNSVDLDLETPFALLVAAPCSLPVAPSIIKNQILGSLSTS